MKIDHIGISVPNLQKTIHWWQKMFNAKVLNEHTLENGIQFANISVLETTFEIFQWTNPLPLPEYRKKHATDLQTIGLKHVAFETNNIKQKMEEFTQMGIKFECTLSDARAGGTHVFFYDCDGIIWELRDHGNEK